MNFDKCKTEFDRYVSNYDIENNDIKRKYFHTYRVVDYAYQIAKSINLDEHDLFLVKVCALLHDIARFKQMTEYGTFNDNHSFDHGNIGFEILIENNYISKYLINRNDINICLKTVKNHNKYLVEDGLSNRELLFVNIIRDSDKIDIMDTQKNTIQDGKKEISKGVMDSFKSQKLYLKGKERSILNNISAIVLQLCFIFDINFKKSFEILEKKKIIKRKLLILKENCEEDIYNEIERIIIDYCCCH